MRSSSWQVEISQLETGPFFSAQAGLFGSRVKNQHGFTMVELITVMIIIGILAAAAVPRFFDSNTFSSRGFHDQLISTLRYAQKIAIAQRSTVCVVDTATEIDVFAADCATPLNVLAKQKCAIDGIDYLNKICAPSGVTITSAHGSLSFTGLGSTPAAKIYTVSGANSITVEAETGYVH